MSRERQVYSFGRDPHRAPSIPIWNPDWGRFSEAGAVFERKPPEPSPQDLRRDAGPHLPLSYHMQMNGGSFIDPETGEECYIKRQAPPEAQGQMHQGMLEGEWHVNYGYGTDYYFAKPEDESWMVRDLDNLPDRVRNGTGYSSIRRENEQRSKYAGGPPKIKQTFAGIQELPANVGYGGEFVGYQQKRPKNTPYAPMTGKEFIEFANPGRNIAPIGGQRIRELPIEGIQTVKGFQDAQNDPVNPGQRSIRPGAGDPLTQRLECQRRNDCVADKRTITDRTRVFLSSIGINLFLAAHTTDDSVTVAVSFAVRVSVSVAVRVRVSF